MMLRRERLSWTKVLLGSLAFSVTIWLGLALIFLL
jgi:hypothetical protein